MNTKQKIKAPIDEWPPVFKKLFLGFFYSIAFLFFGGHVLLGLSEFSRMWGIPGMILWLVFASVASVGFFFYVSDEREGRERDDQ